MAESYASVKREILARVGLSPVCAAQCFHDWGYQLRRPARTQAAELTRLAQHWLMDGAPTAAQVTERVIVDRLLRALPRSHRQAVGMRNPTTTLELVEAIELAEAAHRRDAGERVPPFPRRVVPEQRTPEGISRPMSRTAAPEPRDESMPTAPSPPTAHPWLAGCVLHQDPPVGAPEAEVRINGRPFRALLDSGSAVSLVQARILPPRHETKTRLPITCVHGDTQQVPTRHVTVSAATGSWPIEVGIVRDLPVAVLLGRARYISTLDLTKGYWQVPLSDSAKAKTAFSTPNGHWQYRTLPFGLHGAPATFQRLMDIVLRPHQQYAAAYLDDVVIHSERWEDHLDRLRRVLMELRRAGLAANPRKCHLALFEAKYLGFRVGRGLIKPQERKVEAVRAAPRPSTKTQVRAFLGLAGYYRCFIPNFSSLAAPLTDLTRKGQPECVVWSPETETAFQRIKSALTEEPILHAPDFGCPFLLQTDASETGLGAVLSQVQEGEEHPILFINRKLTPAEKNYATVEKEALAIKWAVLELRYHLLGRKFTLLTDHAPLQWMARAKDTNARVTRWFLALQDFCFVVRHRAGASNANADGLSRIWSAFAGLSGVTPHPTPISPLLLPYVSTGTRTTLRGGECDERPEHSSALPWRRTRITCTSSSRPDQPHLELVYPRLDKPWETRKEGET